jgi:4-nitrophenyl phosphatase
VDRRLIRAQSHLIPAADKVVAVYQDALRSREQLPFLIYHCTMLLCVDLDGVLYRGSEPVPGVGSLLTERVAAGDRVIYITNNSFLRRVEYRSRIEACGAPLSTHGIITAVSAVAQRFVDEGYHHVLVYGAAGFVAELREAGLDACRTAEFDGPESLIAWGVDAVTVGLDRESDWHDLAVAADAVRAGAPLIVPNRDANYPDPGRLVPGTGAAVAALEAATGVHATVIGKPAPDLLLQAAALDGSDIHDAIMIGDSPATDIAAANAAGCRSILLMSGVGAGVGALQINDLPAAQRPTWVARDAVEMTSILAAVAANGAARG